MKKKRFSKLDRIVWNVVMMAAATEAVCGRRFMKRQRKRMRYFSDEAQIEIWLQVCNRMLPPEMQLSLSKVMAKSSIIRNEAQWIYEHILKKPTMPKDELVKRIDKIIKRMIIKKSDHGRDK